MLAFDAPDRRPLKGTRHIFVPSYDKRAGTGSGGAMIHGTMRTHLDEANKQDLCVLSPPVEQDRLTRLLEGRLSYFFRVRGAAYNKAIIKLELIKDRRQELPMVFPTSCRTNASLSPCQS